MVYVAFNVLFNLPHQYCTWVRVVREPVVRRPGHVWRVGAFLLLAFALVALVRADLLGPTNEALLVNFMTYWGLWHLVAQHIGISSLLRRRGGEKDARGRRRDQVFFGLLFALGVVRMHAATALELNVAGNVSHMWRLPIPREGQPWVVGAAVALFAFACAWHLGRAFRENPERAKFQALVAANTFGAFFLTNDILVTTIAVTSFHNIHYVGLVREYQSGRAAADGSARALGWGDVGLALAYSLALNGTLLFSLAAGQVMLVALVALHYLADGRIWRFREDPSLRRYLHAYGS
jgi:hypothetical protein